MLAVLNHFENPYQSFDFESLKKFREHSDLPLIYLFGTGENQNWNDPDYDWSDYPNEKNISDLCYGIGPNKTYSHQQVSFWWLGIGGNTLECETWSKVEPQ